MSGIVVNSGSLHDALQKYTRTENERSANTYAVGYMNRLTDRERPILASSPIFINPPRPDPTVSRRNNNNNNTKLNSVVGNKTKSVWKPPKIQTESEKEAIRKVYQQSIEKPAGTTYTATRLRNMTNDNENSGIITIIPERAWVIPYFFPDQDCDAIISLGERCGIKHAIAGTSYRTSRRSENLVVPELSIMSKNKLVDSPILELVEASRPYTAVRGVHTNWRVGMYEPTGMNSFPPHQDQADVVTVNETTDNNDDNGEEMIKNFYSSTHTLLIALTEPGVDFTGGATRFFPTGEYDDGSTIDVFLPKGYALVFEQKGLLHAGLPVDKLTTVGDGSSDEGDDGCYCFDKKKGAKYIAQASILRGEGDSMYREPEARFKNGPGFSPFSFA